MPLFTYTAKNFKGEITTGTHDARDTHELAATLKQQGFVLVSASEAGSQIQPAARGIWPRWFGRISIQEKMMFARNLAIMIQAGLSLTRALAILQKQTASAKFQSIIASVDESVRKGTTFSESLGAHPHVFSPIFIAMVGAGENSGKLDDALKVLAIQLKNDYELRRKIKGALMYPSVIITAMMLIGVLMLMYVVPTLVSTFNQLGIVLPPTTQFIIQTSNSLIANGIFILVALPFVFYGIWRLLATRTAQLLLDRVLLKLPVISGINKKINSARTARTLSSLIASGVPILKALEITSTVIQNHLYQEVLVRAQADIQKGEPLSQAFIAHTELYPVLMGEMMAVGEETGKTSDMLRHLALFYEKEVAAATKDLSSIIEPVLMIIVGIIVGFFAISMIQPLYGSLEQISAGTPGILFLSRALV